MYFETNELLTIDYHCFLMFFMDIHCTIMSKSLQMNWSIATCLFHDYIIWSYVSQQNMHPDILAIDK